MTSPLPQPPLARQRPARPLRAAFLVLALAATSASAQIRTVLVSPVPGNPAASGTALRNAIAAIAAPSSTNPWLVKVEPGIYDIGTTPLPMRAWVDLEGSGIAATTIQGSVNGAFLNAGTIDGADNIEIRDLTVKAYSSGATTDVIALYNPAASPRLFRVRFVATGRGIWGVRSATGAPRIEQCEFSVTSSGGAGSFAYGASFSAFSGLPAGRTLILGSWFNVSGALDNYGIYMSQGQIVAEIRNSRFDVLGGARTYGLYAAGPSWTGTESLVLRDTEISSGGASSASYGIRFESTSSIYLDVANSTIFGHVAPQTYAISHLGGPAMGIRSSNLNGQTKVIEVGGNLSAATTALAGGPTTATGWIGCIGVWDENAVFYANSCPP